MRKLFGILLVGATGCSDGSGPADVPYSATVMADGPVAFWRFEEMSGTAAADASGNNRGAAYLSSPVLGANVGASRTGAAVSLQTPADGVRISYAGWMDIPNTLTVEAWVRPSRLTSPEGLIVVDRGGVWNLFLDPLGHAAFQIPGNIPPETIAPTPLAINTTYHLAGTFENGVMKLYVNGVLVDDGLATATSISSATTEMHVGRGLTPGTYDFEGVVDEVAIYNKVLSAPAILAHYNAGL